MPGKGTLEVSAGSHDELLAHEYAFEYLFPYPIADLYHRHRVSRSPGDRLGYALACSEAALKFVVGLALALVYDEPSTRKILTADWHSGLASPSFGIWERLLRELGPAVAARSAETTLHAGVARCIGSRADGVGVYLAATQGLVAERNKYVHGQPMVADAANSVLGRLLPLFQAALTELLFLARHPFFVPEEIRRIRHPACFEATVRLCRGSNPIFPFDLWRMNEAIDPNVPMVALPDLSRAYSLEPLLVALPGTLQATASFYFYHKRSRSSFWQSYQVLPEAVNKATDEQFEEFEGWLAGTSRSSVDLRFHGGVKPAWLLSLSPQPASPPGYDVLGAIGEGRFSIVYKAVHTGLKQERALKVLKREAMVRPVARKRFEIEAQAIAKLASRRVTPDLFEYGETQDGVPYLIVELARLGSLEDMRLLWGPAEEARALSLAIDCYRALNTIHSEGIVHRDIKLSNILLINDRPLFCDFGSSRIEADEARLTVDSETLGSLFYMAPEQKFGDATRLSDIYSLAAALTYLLAGSELEDPRKWLYNEFHGQPEFRNILLSAIEPIPENRPLTAAAVAERLSLLQGRLRSEQAGSEPTAITDGAILPKARPRPSRPNPWESTDGTRFCRIAGGEFLMGGSKFPDERPIHCVRISKDFFLAATPVTNRQFSSFCAKTGYRSGHVNFLTHLRRGRGGFSPFWQEPHAPVVFVSWQDAKQYVLWCCERDSLDYRLPTEAEWEYACRAGTQTVYYWGNHFDPNKANAGKGDRGCPVAVGAYPPNHWGLFDMLGNVWEWCEDFMDARPGEESIYYRECSEQGGGVVIDPLNSGPNALVSDRMPPGIRVGRGGSFFSKPHNCRPANRRGSPFDVPTRAFGFRIALYDE